MQTNFLPTPILVIVGVVALAVLLWFCFRLLERLLFASAARDWGLVHDNSLGRELLIKLSFATLNRAETQAKIRLRDILSGEAENIKLSVVSLTRSYKTGHRRKRAIVEWRLAGILESSDWDFPQFIISPQDRFLAGFYSRSQGVELTRGYLIESAEPELARQALPRKLVAELIDQPGFFIEGKGSTLIFYYQTMGLLQVLGVKGFCRAMAAFMQACSR